MKLDAYGRKIEVIKIDGHWQIFVLGEGTKRIARDFVIPSHYSEDEVIVFLEDMLHEAATPERPRIIRLD